MIVDGLSQKTLPEFTSDVCIVGAGAAGLVLAAELVRQGKRVLLLESGGLQVEAAAQELNRCFTTGQPHRGASLGRFRVLGGTTTAWGGQISELNPEDFAIRPWIAGSGWPFSKQNLQHYYDRALVAEGLGTVIYQDEEIWRRVRRSQPNFPQALELYFTRWCPDPDFARLYRSTLESPNLLVVLHTTAISFNLAENGTHVRSIACSNLSGATHSFAASKYVLCLGTIESTRFLLQPLAGEQIPSWNQSGMVGKNFQSHIDVNVAQVPAHHARRLHSWMANIYLDGLKYHPKFRLHPAIQQQEQILNIAGSVTCIHPAEMEMRRVKARMRNLLRRGEWQSLGQDVPATFRYLPTMLQLAYSYRVHRRAAWPPSSTFWLRAHCEQEPTSSSQIALSQDRDAVGMFRAIWDRRISDLEWKTIRTFTAEAQRSFASLGINILPRPELNSGNDLQQMVLDDSYHHMGGTRMAAAPTQGVVDTNLKLHGLENAYVCSASVFPASGFSNPTHTLLALAIRLADYLVADRSRAIASLSTQEFRHA